MSSWVSLGHALSLLGLPVFFCTHRKTHEHRGHSSQNISRQTSSKRHHEEKPTLQDRSREGEIQKGGKNMEDVTPYFQLSELDAVGSHSRRRELSRCGALGVLSLDCELLVH